MLRKETKGFTPVRFDRHKDKEFFIVLRKRVGDYFASNNISKFADYRMVIKTIAMLLIYFTPYALVLSGAVTNGFWFYMLWLWMGVGMAGIGLSVMHDANHNAYSSNKRVNQLIGYVINLVGGSAINWKLQHNVLHHSYTNVHEKDEDIEVGTLMRFTPHDERRRFHKYQHLYAWFLYGQMTLFWSTAKDFFGLARYKKKGLIKGGATYRKEIAKLAFSKVIYQGYALVLPLIFAPFSWWFIVICFVSMHFLCGLILACIFQPAHVVPATEFPLPDLNGKMSNNWAIHQLLTTSNFAPGSRIFSWYVGGLNYQIEHHLFPSICHIHYKKLSEIVQRTTQEFGLPYHTQKTFAKALYSHAQVLYRLGREPEPIAC